MPAYLQRFTAADIPRVAALWREATDQRRRDLGVGPAHHGESALQRPGAFGVGAYVEGELRAMAVALPALADDARSRRAVPGLAHISSVATLPGHWGQGLGGEVVRAVMGQAARRGYARAQLWTHLSNRAAQRLYTREGFTDVGRRRVDDNGEPIMHYIRTLPQPPVRSRRAARMICLDPDGRILLMHWRDPVDGYCLWEPPGGGIEAGETPYDAVCREWGEETALPVPDLVPDPVTVARDEVWRGHRIVTDEDFFLATATTAAATVDTSGFTANEQVDGLGQEWVHWSKLEALEDPVEPDLLSVLRRVRPDGPW